MNLIYGVFTIEPSFFKLGGNCKHIIFRSDFHTNTLVTSFVHLFVMYLHQIRSGPLIRPSARFQRVHLLERNQATEVVVIVPGNIVDLFLSRCHICTVALLRKDTVFIKLTVACSNLFYRISNFKQLGTVVGAFLFLYFNFSVILFEISDMFKFD